MSGARLRLAIFDVDGTLVDSQNAIYAAMSAAFAACGLPVPPRDRVLGIVGLSLPQAMASLLPDDTAEVHAQLVEAYRQSFLTARTAPGGGPPAPLFPGIREVLDGLSARPEVLLGVATGKARRGLDHLCAVHGLETMFVTRQTADDHPSKPHPSMVTAALSETGIAPADAVMIGDTTFDIEMGKAAGVRSLGVGWGYHASGALMEAGAETVVEDARELAGALHRMWGTRP